MVLIQEVRQYILSQYFLKNVAKSINNHKMYVDLPWQILSSMMIIINILWFFCRNIWARIHHIQGLQYWKGSYGYLFWR